MRLLFFLFAAPAIACPFTVDELARRNTSCGTNEITFGAAAVECVEDFERKADRVSRELAASMVGGKNDALAKVSHQDEFHGSAQANYESAKKKLDNLIAGGNASLREVEGYAPQLAYPEDYSRFPNRKFLESSHCYIDNVNLLKTVQRDFRRKLAELEKTRAFAFGQGKESKAHKNAMEAKTSLAPLPRGKGQGSQKMPAGTSGNRGSDITGTDLKLAP
jgi:hypothetical protein